jgi:hypothetical protein
MGIKSTILFFIKLNQLCLAVGTGYLLGIINLEIDL